MSFGRRGKVSCLLVVTLLLSDYKITKKYAKERTNLLLMFGLVPRLFQDLRYSMRRAPLVYFHSRVWHSICYSPKMVYFTAQECEENEERKGRTDF